MPLGISFTETIKQLTTPANMNKLVKAAVAKATAKEKAGVPPAQAKDQAAKEVADDALKIPTWLIIALGITGVVVIGGVVYVVTRK